MPDQLDYQSNADRRHEVKRRRLTLRTGLMLVSSFVLVCIGLVVVVKFATRRPAKVHVDFIVVNKTNQPIANTQLMDYADTPACSIPLVPPGMSQKISIAFPANDVFARIAFTQANQTWYARLDPTFYDYGGTYTAIISPGKVSASWGLGDIQVKTPTTQSYPP